MVEMHSKLCNDDFNSDLISIEIATCYLVCYKSKVADYFKIFEIMHTNQTY